MCGRYTLKSPPEVLAEQFELPEVPRFEPRYNIAPTQQVSVVRLDPRGGRELAQLRWGLIPSWADDPAIGSRMINARAEAVAALYERDRLGAAEILSGSRASRARLHEAMTGRRHLHLATHGYFAPPERRSALAPEDRRDALAQWEGMGQVEVSGWYPGLVWADASDPLRDPATGTVEVGAGLMTAEEVAGLDLKGCELAVLSACETGLGRTAGGDGVLGLQRAFQQAGVRTVIASLWKVDDTATATLMQRFYTGLWEEGRAPLEASRAAQLSLMDDPEFGAGGNPQLWAAWVLSGDPGGLHPVDLPHTVDRARPEDRP